MSNSKILSPHTVNEFLTEICKYEHPYNKISLGDPYPELEKVLIWINGVLLQGSYHEDILTAVLLWSRGGVLPSNNRRDYKLSAYRSQSVLFAGKKLEERSGCLYQLQSKRSDDARSKIILR